jgi:phosphate starvation-inducible protein PhoH and related proteins
LGISALTPPTAADDVVETLLEFPDNRLLIGLCGEYDRNLAQIEHQMGVHILPRGNRLSVIGDKGGARTGGGGAAGLYARLEAGARRGHAGDIDGAIRLGRPECGDTLPRANRSRCFRAASTNCAPARNPSNPGPRRKRPMSRRCSTMNWPSASGLRAPARPIWPSPWA